MILKCVTVASIIWWLFLSSKMFYLGRAEIRGGRGVEDDHS